MHIFSFSGFCLYLLILLNNKNDIFLNIATKNLKKRKDLSILFKMEINFSKSVILVMMKTKA